MSGLIKIVNIGVIFFLLSLDFASPKKLPNYIPTCKRNLPDKEFDKCLSSSLETIRPYLAKGIQKIKVPPLEPLRIPQLEIIRDLDNLKIKANLKDIHIYGASGYKLHRVKGDTKTHSIEAKVSLPHIYITADYDVDGRLLVVPLKGKGLFKGNFTNSLAEIKAYGETFNSSKGTKYLRLKNISTKLKVGDQNVAFDNRDNNRNNAVITQTALTFINQNRRQVLDIVTPIAEETVEAFIIQLGNMILRSIPYNELLPE